MRTAFMSYYSHLTTTTPMVVRYPTGGTSYTVSISAGSYCAQTLADAINTNLMSQTSNALSCSFDPSAQAGRYYISSSTGTNFDIVSIDADYQGILGTYTANNIANTAGNLGIDPRTYILKRGVHWDSPTQVLPHTHEMAQTGRILGRSYGTAAGYQQWSIDFISNARATHEPASQTVYDQLERTLDRFSAGSKMRVYLNWTDGSKDTSAWSTSNTDGYIDIVSTSVDAVEYEWTSDVLRYARVSVSGMEE